MADKRYEIVLAVQTDQIPEEFRAYGLNSCSWEDWEEETWGARRVHWQRFRLEENPEFQQLIPHVVLVQNGKIFAFARLKGAEARLSQKIAVGVGGHMNLEDDADVVKAGHREFKEEIKVKGRKVSLKQFKERLTFLGTLKGDKPVDLVHLGMVFLLDVSGWEIVPRNKKEMEGGFVSLNDFERSPQWEGWTEILAESEAFHKAVARLSNA